MQKILLFSLVCLLISTSCNDQKRPETAMNTARTFIDASLDGDFQHAEPLVMADSLNQQMYQMYKSHYAKLPEKTKKGYAEAGYNIDSYEELNDSTVIVHYSNDFMHKPINLKVVKQSGQWWIDFQMISATDSISAKP